MYRFFLVIILSLFAQTLFAAKPDTIVIEKPTAILFMLQVSVNKIEALKKRGMQKEAEDVSTADFEINNSIVRDFEKYFTWCPVYFFYDTQLLYVQKRQWERVLFYDFEHFKTNKKIEISSIDNFLIAEVNYPPMTTYASIDENGNVHQPEYSVEYANARDYGIICYDQQFNLLKNKLQYTNIAMRRVGNIFKPETIKYKFSGSQLFQERLKKYYGTPPKP